MREYSWKSLSALKFPYYKQLDAMDCGPTCLRMIARHYGKIFSIGDLRAKSFITREGVSLLGISEAAESVGFRTLGAKISYQQLSEDVPLPCIVHWSQNHFVVVYKIKKDKVYIADPAEGLITLTKIEFERSWIVPLGENQRKVGIALLVEPTPTFYQAENSDIMNGEVGFSYVFSYLWNYQKLLAQLVIGLLLGSLIQLILPFLTQSIVDVGIGSNNINFIYLVLATWHKV